MGGCGCGSRLRRASGSCGLMRPHHGMRSFLPYSAGWARVATAPFGALSCCRDDGTDLSPEGRVTYLLYVLRMAYAGISGIGTRTRSLRPPHYSTTEYSHLSSHQRLIFLRINDASIGSKAGNTTSSATAQTPNASAKKRIVTICWRHTAHRKISSHVPSGHHRSDRPASALACPRANKLWNGFVAWDPVLGDPSLPCWDRG